LDPKGNGRVSFVQFVRAVSQVGKFDVRRMWPFLDDNNSGFVTLDEWDHDSFVHLMEFRQICLDEYGSMNTAFQFGIDTSGSGTATRDELKAFCKNFEYTKSPDRLFHCLDWHHRRYITVGDLDFLSHWQGERFRHNRSEYRIPAARKALMYAQRGRQRVREAQDVLLDGSFGSAGESTTRCGTTSWMSGGSQGTFMVRRRRLSTAPSLRGSLCPSSTERKSALVVCLTSHGISQWIARSTQSVAWISASSFRIWKPSPNLADALTTSSHSVVVCRSCRHCARQKAEYSK
jgi:Ca2+-binding EF-hand superfamily protein